MGKHSNAESTYKKFIKEYEILYGQKYKHPFVDVLKMNSKKNQIQNNKQQSFYTVVFYNQVNKTA